MGQLCNLCVCSSRKRGAEVYTRRMLVLNHLSAVFSIIDS